MPRTSRQLPADPLERIVPLSLKILLYAFLTVYLIQAAETFIEFQPGQHWPFLLRAIRNGIFLFIHEGGHGLFMFFGRTLHVLGGSFWQIMFPVISFIIAVRKRSHVVAPFALFWAGANMLDVSLYMRDAPVRVLPLLGPRSGHDWFYLFNKWGVLDSAGTIADLTYYLGLFICIGSILVGMALAVQRYLNPLPYALPETPAKNVRPSNAQLAGSLERMLKQNEQKDPFEGGTGPG
jgi:hypothetical protein